MFLIPTKLMPTALTPLFSFRTKLRMALELLHPPRPSQEDESVATLVERHFGHEAVDRLADPLLSGIYGGDATRLSARTVLPRLVEMEAEYGSLSRGMLAAHKKMRAAMAAKGRRRHAIAGGPSEADGRKECGPAAAFSPPCAGACSNWWTRWWLGSTRRPSGWTPRSAPSSARAAAGGSPLPGKRSFTTR